jgi:hypothetical protein
MGRFYDYGDDVRDSDDGIVEDARSKLMDYYGTAMVSGMGMAGADLANVQSMSDDDVIREAKKMRLI